MTNDMEPIKAAYADPPYLGCGKLYAAHHVDALEWDQPERHRRLIGELCKNFDCWAMSLSSPSLQTILPMCPSDVRVMAWVKPFAVFKPNVGVAYAWEPVIVRLSESRKRTDARAAGRVAEARSDLPVRHAAFRRSGGESIPGVVEVARSNSQGCQKGTMKQSELVQTLDVLEAEMAQLPAAPWWAGDGTERSYHEGSYALLHERHGLDGRHPCIMLSYNSGFPEDGARFVPWIVRVRELLPEMIATIRQLYASNATLRDRCDVLREDRDRAEDIAKAELQAEMGKVRAENARLLERVKQLEPIKENV